MDTSNNLKNESSNNNNEEKKEIVNGNIDSDINYTLNSFSVKSPNQNILFSHSNLSDIEERPVIEEMKKSQNEVQRNLIKSIDDNLIHNIEIKIEEIEENILKSSKSLNSIKEDEDSIHEIRDNDLLLIEPEKNLVHVEEFPKDQNLSIIKLNENFENKNETILSNEFDKVQSINCSVFQENEKKQEEEEKKEEKEVEKEQIKKSAIQNFSKIILNKLQAFDNKNSKKNFEIFWINFQNKFNFILLDNDPTQIQKLNYFAKKKFFGKFLKSIKSKIIKKKFTIYNHSQSEKFERYRNHKIKNKIFDNIKTLARNKKNWLIQVRREIKINSLW